ncbi:hypothetical protein G7046_g7854 [Stylonectria norvegica]|nr:hypothetical protein G7046_g7854 [Stylonectria norvegica]
MSVSTPSPPPGPRAQTQASPLAASPDSFVQEPRNQRNRPVFLHDIFVIRFVNALWIATFFQPDEFFQALEPAWNLAFGSESGAWLTWVCKNPLFDYAVLFFATTLQLSILPTISYHILSVLATLC